LRKDMGRLLVEHPRHGLRGKHKRQLDPREDLDDLPTREHMGRNWHPAERELGDRLAPLKRFLTSAIGRPWDDVWSEITRSTNRWEVKGDHLLQHVRHSVYMTPGEWRAVNDRYAWGSPHGFFVDDEGVLRYRAHQRRRRRIHEAKEFGVVEIAYMRTEIREIGGTWWRVDLAPVDAAALGKIDVVTGEVVRVPGFSNAQVAFRADPVTGALPRSFSPKGCLYERRGLWAASRQELTREELIRLGLRRLVT